MKTLEDCGLPHVINVGPYRIAVVMKEGLANQDGFRGICCLAKNEIELDPGYEIQTIRQAFFHEIIEAIKGTYDRTLEHADIDIYANGLLQALGPLIWPEGKE